VENDKINRWHTGSLPGSAALLVRRHDGRNWAVLLNTRVSAHSSHLARTIDPLLHQAADEVTRWPDYDLFDRPPW
jgi:N-acyl-D-amino-acid deacylase